ncbi:MAG: ACT domain-containing protein [Oscillibacter sp.]|nr:ACT domain-containing protein [Oscillibacter sp.]
MNAIVTVIGEDRVGIIAAVCSLLAENNVNILDITQTILQGNFTMVMAVDVGKTGVPLAALSEKLDALGTSMKISIRIQREEIFNAMHRI